MTCEQFEPGQWRLGFNETEGHFIFATLALLGRHYADDIAGMPPALRAYWLGSMSRGESPVSEQARQLQEDLAESRAELRGDRLALLENWMRDYELSEQHDPWRVEVTTGERDEFLAMLNDRRMMLALETGITEDDMESDLGQVPSEARRKSILEIDILGQFILVMLGPQIYRP